MQLGITMRINGQMPKLSMDEVLEAERLGYESVWSGEAWGTDAVSPVAWVLARTTKIKAGTAIMQMQARTPACTAMTAMTLNALSGGRFLLGVGPSGPQVIEGWHGVAYGKPLGRTKEYIEIIRKALAREAALTFQGEHYQIPYAGPGATGLGKPLRSIVHGDPSMKIYTASITPAGLRTAGDPGRPRESGKVARPERVRSGAVCEDQHGERPSRMPRCAAAEPGAVYRRDGRALEEFLQRLRSAAWVRGGGCEDPGSVS